MTTPTTLLIPGASSDLTRRLLLPGLGSLLERDPGRPLRIVGVDRADLGADAFVDRLAQALAEGGASDDVVGKHRRSAVYHQLDVTDSEAFSAVLAGLGATDRLVIYFALPPAVTERACQALVSCRLPKDTHLAMEKPFGYDLASARSLNKLLARLVPEDRVVPGRSLPGQVNRARRRRAAVRQPDDPERVERRPHRVDRDRL